MSKKFTLGSFKLALIVFACLFVFSNVLLGFSSGGFIVNLKDVGFSAFSTIQKGVNSAVHGVAEGFKAVKELAVLKKEYAILVEKLADYEYFQRDYAKVREENEYLKKQLEISEEFERKNIVARVIGRDPNALYSALTINKGTKHGIRKNMPVVAIQGGDVALVGKIVTVGPLTSMVMPIYDFQYNVSGRIRSTHDVGLISGRGTESEPLQMSYIKKSVYKDLQYGDLVVTSGENDNYLANIPIGSISNVKVIDYDSSLQIDIIPIIDFARLENVMVIDLKYARE
ncbi:MAG: rod shape-determining protein MreC [Treponemataceae bacterium]|nr:rod shape-determining protein MreC [Spirochaetales bacterium]MDY6031902.1 rod shape-determining protein MreC [Treponemataceae bacterium]